MARSRAAYLARKSTYAFITVVIVIVFNFLLFRVMPGDPARILIPRGHNVPLSLIARMREFYGLDKPLPTQLVSYVIQTLQLNLGYSFYYKAPVADVIAAWLPNTLLLVGISEVIAILLGFSTGAIAGWRRGKRFDLFATSFGLTTWSMPTFWLGIVLIMVFSVQLGIFPVGGVRTAEMAYTNIFQQIEDVGMHLILPVITLTLVSFAEYLMIMRNSLVDVMTEDFVLTARAKGLKESTVINVHARRNALIPVFTLLGYTIAWLLGGVVLIEAVFNYLGIGYWTTQAMLNGDVGGIMGATVILGLTFIFANLGVDIAYGFLDPRIRH